jgi:hypothetical protein
MSPRGIKEMRYQVLDSEKKYSGVDFKIGKKEKNCISTWHLFCKRTASLLYQTMSYQSNNNTLQIATADNFNPTSSKSPTTLQDFATSSGLFTPELTPTFEHDSSQFLTRDMLGFDYDTSFMINSHETGMLTDLSSDVMVPFYILTSSVPIRDGHGPLQRLPYHSSRCCSSR